MVNLTPSMRLKVKRDTFFLPEPNRGVYFRNNISSFRMEGTSIVQWIEKLLPMFNGNHTLSELTDGLPDPYRNRVMEIAEVLYGNGFVRDLSQDSPHQLREQVLERYASQIEFLESCGDSGAHRFETYRKKKVLAIGSGPFFLSLVSSLIESGLPAFRILITDTVPTNRKRLNEIVAHARKTDDEVAIEEVMLEKGAGIEWQEIVRPFDSILYVSQEGDIQELRELHSVCRQGEKTLFPALIINQVGMAGPLVHPDSKGCWESAWHRLHQAELEKNQESSFFSATAGAMLANIMVFEWFKDATGVTTAEQANQFYLLDMDTLEGKWHPFIPHLGVTGKGTAAWIEDFERRLEQKADPGDPGKVFMYFSRLTSSESGIFHRWDEGDLKQLPLAQCRVQVVDSLSSGPAELLPEIIRSDLTHEEARRETGLAGVEAYASRTLSQLVATLPPLQGADEIKELIGVGAGETFAECVCRGLQSSLDTEFLNKRFNQEKLVTVQLSQVEDERCRYYLQALTRLQGDPIIALGEEVSGFPVVWAGTSDGWSGAVGLNVTIALRNALQKAVMKVQNQTVCLTAPGLVASPVLDEEKVNLVIPSCGVKGNSELVQSAIQVLKKNSKRICVFELKLEPLLKEEMAGVFGVFLREEESW
ncbi:putative thiazole-containing bacteriocin maturation protein [Peribacillus frigoritolerans]|uniref:putative thiazole-containing bacteriocin maturation protein n=1 Tax=Peribacillus frigoritolerans TaxID=450367 RepID=UPI0025A125D9|nr:putative thiazole-containing bacteriocin maturation protein [Peribacillus frigoritolerans]MDM5308263.1 putative thiazole-containing bacteriocin maturation protein [Peribacillus frigoritolerans]